MGEIEDLIGKVSPRYSKGAIWENKISYDTTTSTLEPLYYWIIDFMAGYKPEKLIDNFTAAPGSAHFADLGARATKMQEEGMKILGSVNVVIKSILNLIYDLKNFQLRLKEYDKLKSKDPDEKARGILALKEIWMNSVDANRGMGSINNMAQQYGFTLLRPAFMASMPPKGGKLKDAVKMIDKMDLNETVKNILKPRVSEFYDWIELSEMELTKRYEIQRSYLKNQVASLKLYSSWVRPYLQAAEQLRMKENKEPSLVSIFSSMILELTLLAKKKIEIEEEVAGGSLPPAFKEKAKEIRTCWQVILVDFKFRTYPTQGAPHTGKVDIIFKAYALNDDEMLLFEKLREDELLTSMLGVSDQLTGETLKQLENDLKDILEDTKKEEPKKKSDLLLFSGGESLFRDLSKEIKKYFVPKTRAEKDKEEKEKKDKDKKDKEEKKNKLKEEGVSDDSYEEAIVRDYTELSAAEFAFKTFDVFKKSQGMASFPSPFDAPEIVKRFREKRSEISLMLKGGK